MIEVTKARAVSTSSIWIIVSLIFFIVHWKIYKNTQNKIILNQVVMSVQIL